MIDPCNDGYEESERVRILGEGYRNAETMRYAEKMNRDTFCMKVSAFILFVAIAGIITILVTCL